MDSNGPPASSRAPQRGRSGYPAHLARNGQSPRVPLHRRGTSQKLEYMEDLLREAGFKETRIFTPEAERAEVAAAEARRRQSERRKEGDEDGGGETKRPNGLLRFLSGIVSWSDSEGDVRKVQSGHAKTQSLGKVSGKQREILLNDDDEHREATDVSSDVGVTTPPNRRKPLTPIILASDFSSPESSSSASSRSPPQLQRPAAQHMHSGPSRRHLGQAGLDARSTLRHMISLPEFVPPGQSSRRAFLRRATEKPLNNSMLRETYQTRNLGMQPEVEGATESVPPLPQNWLSTVATAVMNASGSGARIGRPQTPRQHTRPKSARMAPRPLPDIQSEYTRHDGGLARRGFAPCTPRADTTPGIVTPASVVCRSAPSSRSSSLVRKPTSNRRTHGRPRNQADACMPCLGVTSVHVDGSGLNIEATGAYSNTETARSSLDGTDDVYDDSSDEDEIDFARLLVPARRQHSIQSLRRNLHNHAIASAASGGRKAPPSAFIRVPKKMDSRLSFGSATGRRSRDETHDDPDDPEDLLRSRRVSTDEEDEESILADWAAHGLPGLQSAVHKKRGALPWTSRKQSS